MWIRKHMLSHSSELINNTWHIWYLYLYFWLCDLCSLMSCVCVWSSSHAHLVALWPHWLKDWKMERNAKLNPLASDPGKKFRGKRKALHDICSDVRDVLVKLLSMCCSERALDCFSLESMLASWHLWELVWDERELFYLHGSVLDLSLQYCVLVCPLIMLEAFVWFVEINQYMAG